MLYSADFSGCAAVPHLTESELSEIFALVLQSAGATIVHAHCHAPWERGHDVRCDPDRIPRRASHVEGFRSGEHRYLLLFQLIEGPRGD